MAKKSVRKLDEVARQIADQRFGKGSVKHIKLTDGRDSDGDPSLYVRFVMKERFKSSGELLAQVSVDLQDALRERNDPRFVYTRYLTEADAKELQES